MSYYLLNENGERLDVTVGMDVSAFWNITKYEPVIPAGFAGDVYNIGMHNVVKYDIENIKKYPDVLTPDDDVVVTEKIHGSCMIVGYVEGTDCPDLYQNECFVTSKGMGAQGLVFKFNDTNQTKNVYIRVAVELGLMDKLREWCKKFGISRACLVGEVFGRGVQDLQYGQDKPVFRAFDLWVPSSRFNAPMMFSDAMHKYGFFDDIGVYHVPVLYRGKFDRAKINELTDGKTMAGGENIREGVVVTPSLEKQHYSLGRVILKSVSEAYLTRKGDNLSEFN